MKRLVYIIITFIFFFFLVLNLISFGNKVITKLASPIPAIPTISFEPTPNKPSPNETEFDNKIYQFYYRKIQPNESLTLIPNFKESSFSAQIVKQNNCTLGINGGFYKKEGGPLGLFFAEKKLIGEKIQSITFNGILSKKDGKLSILPAATVYPSYTSSDFLLQSGPLIFLKNKLQPNFIDRDFSRRHLIAKSITGEFYLFSIFEKDNKFNGPRLEDLRPIFLSPDFKTIADFELLLNLDGGSASAFYDRGVQVEEFKPIGSFLCGKEQN